MRTGAASLRQLAISRPDAVRTALTALAAELGARLDGRAQQVAALAESGNLAQALDHASALLTPLLRMLPNDLERVDPAASARVAQTRVGTMQWEQTDRPPAGVELIGTSNGLLRRFQELDFATPPDLDEMRRLAAVGDMEHYGVSLQRLADEVQPELQDRTAMLTRQLGSLHTELQKLLTDLETRTAAYQATEESVLKQRTAAADEAIKELQAFNAAASEPIPGAVMEMLESARQQLGYAKKVELETEVLPQIRREISKFASPDALRTMGASARTIEAVGAFLELGDPREPRADLTSIRALAATQDRLATEIFLELKPLLLPTPRERHLATIEALRVGLDKARAEVEAGRWLSAGVTMQELGTTFADDISVVRTAVADARKGPATRLLIDGKIAVEKASEQASRMAPDVVLETLSEARALVDQIPLE
jgi:hypothetical protein